MFVQHLVVLMHAPTHHFMQEHQKEGAGRSAPLQQCISPKPYSLNIACAMLSRGRKRTSVGKTSSEKQLNSKSFGVCYLFFC